MQLRKKIQSYFLLATYLLIVLHYSVSHSHDLVYGGAPESNPSHKHENFKEVHHENHFHVGIFHFLGHLFESLDHSNDLSEDHLIIIQKAGTKKIVEHNNPTSIYFETNKLKVFEEVDVESLSDPPYHLSVLQKLKLPSTPLRAPPSLV